MSPLSKIIVERVSWDNKGNVPTKRMYVWRTIRKYKGLHASHNPLGIYTWTAVAAAMGGSKVRSPDRVGAHPFYNLVL